MGEIRYWFFIHRKHIIIGTTILVVAVVLILLIFSLKPKISEDIENELDATDTESVVKNNDPVESYPADPDLPDNSPKGTMEINLSKPTSMEEEFLATLDAESRAKYESIATMADTSYAGDSIDNGDGARILNHLESFSTITQSTMLVSGSLQVWVQIPESLDVPAQWIGAVKRGSKEVVLATGSPWAGYKLVIPNVTETDTVVIDLSPRVIENGQ